MEMILQVVMAFVGTVAFSVLFSVPRKYYVDCGITGAVGWAVYLAVNNYYHTPIVATFLASAVLTALARYLAVKCQAPTTVFLLCGIFTLVPGAGIYYTAYHIFVGEEQLAMTYGIDSIKLAVAIGLGIGAAYSIPSAVFGWKRRPEVWGEEN